jgi:single-strand DNA-binding protein
MAIKALVEGNLTKNPEGRTVLVNNEPRAIVELRVFSDVRRRVGDEWEQDEEKSKAVDVTVWQESLGEALLKTLRKGTRVLVEGDLHLNEYTDGEGVHHAGLRMAAERVSILPWRIDQISYAAKRGERESEPA